MVSVCLPSDALSSPSPKFSLLFFIHTLQPLFTHYVVCIEQLVDITWELVRMQDLNPVQTSQTRVCTVANSQEIHIHGAVWEAPLLNCTSGYHWTERGRRPWSVTPQSAPAALCLLYPNTMREEGGEKIGGHPKGGGNDRKLKAVWASWHRLPDYLQVSCCQLFST